MLPRKVPARAGLVVVLALAGCSGTGPLATVSGVVTLDNNPVDGARVMFHSTTEVDGKAGATFSSLTDSSGKYLIASSGKLPGIPAGVYKVTIVKYEGKGPTNVEGMDAGQIEAQLSDGGGAAKASGPVNLMPKAFANPGSTKLSSTLDVGKNENVNFALKSK